MGPISKTVAIDYWPVGEGARAPERHQGVALDLCARLPRWGWRIVWGFARIPTGVALAIPQNAAVRITGRSGNFLRGILVHDGLVESEFNGNEVCALIYCPSPRIVRHGQRIAQMWTLRVDRGAFRLNEGPTADVGAAKGGFGSTGR